MTQENRNQKAQGSVNDKCMSELPHLLSLSQDVHDLGEFTGLCLFPRMGQSLGKTTTDRAAARGWPLGSPLYPGQGEKPLLGPGEGSAGLVRFQLSLAKNPIPRIIE